MSESIAVQRLVYEGVPAVVWVKERDKEERTYWVAEWYLLEKCRGLTSEYLKKVRHQYKQSLKPAWREKDFLKDSAAAWRFMRKERGFYYDYNRIPDFRGVLYRSQLGSLQNLKAMIKETKVVSERTVMQERLQCAMVDGWKAYTHCYLGYTQEHQEKLGKACAAIEVILGILNEYEIDVKRMDFWKMAGEELEAMCVGYVPHNYRRLKDKSMLALTSSIVEVVDVPRLGNTNAKTHDMDKELKGWAVQLRSMGENWTDVYIRKKLVEMCKLTDKVVPSDSWFNSFFAKPKTKLLTAEGRFGLNSKRANLYKGYVPIQNALFAGDCWQMDATRINMIDFKETIMVNDKVAKKATFLMKLTIIDVHSGDVVGIHIDTKEDRKGYMAALGMAVKQTGYLPYQIIFDRFPGHNSDEFKEFIELIEKMGVKVDFVHKSSGKAKQERLYNTLQTVFYQGSAHYYGEGIMSKNVTARRSDAYMSRVRKEAHNMGWNWEACWQETIRVVDNYRNMPYCSWSKKYKKEKRSPRAVHDESEKPNVFVLENKHFVLLFGGRTKWTVRGPNVALQILEQERLYIIEDFDFLARYGGQQLVVRFDYDDLNMIWFYDEERREVGSASLQERVSMYGPTANFGELAKLKAKHRKIDDAVKAEFDHHLSFIGHDVDMLLGALGNKEASNAAEDAYLIASFDRVAVVKEGKKVVDVDVRNMY